MTICQDLRRLGDHFQCQLDHPQVDTVTRTYEDEKFLVIVHLSDRKITYDIPRDFATGEVLIANYPHSLVADTIQLQSHEALTMKKEVVA
jgi:hypothetical protein